MATLRQEADEILNRANQAIQGAMNAQIAEGAKGILSAAVKEIVYPNYEPTEYVRRRDSGGLSDRDMYEVTEDGGGGDVHEIIVADNRHEVGVVESGTGYTWIHSQIYRMQPYPRPYFSYADARVEADPFFDFALEYALRSV